MKLNIESELYEWIHDMFWNSSADCFDRYNNVGDDIEGTLSEVLGKYKDEGKVKEFTTEDETVFESCGCDAGYAYACWIDKDGKLGTVSFAWSN